MDHIEAVARPVTRHVESLHANGYAIVEQALPRSELMTIAAEIEARFLRTPTADGDFVGRSTKRFGGILKRAPATRAMVMHPDMLAAANAILGPNCDHIQLNVAEASEIGVGEIAQVPHRDDSLWPSRVKGMEHALSAVWPLSETVLRVWPGSHGGAAEFPETPIEIALAPASALLLLGSVMRGAAGNSSSLPRRLVTAGYCLGWLKPYENQWLTYPPDVAKNFDAELAALVGYRRDRPNLGCVDGDCPTLLFENPAAVVRARDALTADQTSALAAYREIQLAVEADDGHAL